MRFKDSQEQLSYLKRASDMGNMELVYAGLDVLGVTPWRVNRAIFDVVLAVWNSGEKLGKLPPVVLDYPEPERPDNYETDMKARSVYLHRQKAYNQAKANNHSDRCSVNYKIEIARAVSPCFAALRASSDHKPSSVFGRRILPTSQHRLQRPRLPHTTTSEPYG